MRFALRLLAAQGATGGKLLDFGCGVGRWREFFVNAGFSWSGCDLSGGMIQIARDSLPSGSDLKKLTLGAPLPYPDAGFDVAVSLAVLHHNDHDGQAALLAELARVTAPGGFVILFESVRAGGPAQGRGAVSSGVETPRTFDEWISLAESLQLKSRAVRGAKFSVIEPIATRLPGAAGRLASRLLAPVDPWLSPALGPRLPRRVQDRGLFIFQKDTAAAPGIPSLP